MEEPLLKKKSKKIRCTQEFNNLNRSSLFASLPQSESEKNAVTKKNKNLSYLPKIYFNVEPIKENCSPNVTDKKLTKKSKKKSRVFDKQSIESTEMIVRCERSGTSTEEDKRDSEIQFKKKRRRKQKNQAKRKQESSSDVMSENELQITDMNKKSITTPVKSTLMNSISINDKSNKKHIFTPQGNEKLFDNEGSKDSGKKTEKISSEYTIRKSRNAFLKAHKSFNGHTSESVAPRSISVKRKSKNVPLIARQSNVHTSESLAPSPNSDLLSDNVFGENVNDTLELLSVTNYKDNLENSDKNYLFDFPGRHSIKSMNTDGNRSVRFTTQPVVRQSRSWDGSLNISNVKPTCMTPEKNNVLKMESTKKGPIKDKKSLNTSNKRSVSFASVDSSRSKGEHSKIFPKSPHISRVSKTASLLSKGVTHDYKIRKSESFTETNFFQNESLAKTPRKYSRKPTMSSFETSDKKSVSFFTPVNNNKNRSKISFKKSPYLHRSTNNNVSVSSSDNSPNNETFQLTSPTIELETLKNQSILLSPIPTLSEIITPSPESKLYETKSTGSFSYSLQKLLNTCDDKNKTACSSEGNKSDIDMKVTKRKHWNRSLGASIVDNLGMLHNISSPWEKETNDFQCIEHNYSRNSFISPIKKINSPKKYLPAGCRSTEKSMSTKKVQENLEKSLSTIQPETVIAETLSTSFSPIKNEEPEKKLLQFQHQVKRTKLPNFALIHQRAYDKLEDVKEMSQRKAARAQQLLSGKKPGPGTNMKIPPSNLKIKSPTSKIKSPKSRKLLRYSLKKRQSLENTKIQKLESPTSTIAVTKTHTKIAPSTSNVKKIPKPVQKKLIKSQIPKPVHVDKKPLSRLGFKVGLTGNDKVLRQEHLKAAANKTKPNRNSLEARRNVIQNVRTNRRFELLMKMRKKD